MEFFRKKTTQDFAKAANESGLKKKLSAFDLAICLAVVIVMYIVVSLVLTGMVPFKQIDVNDALPGVGAVIGMISTLLVSVGILVLRKIMPDVERKFKCPGVPFTSCMELSIVL